MKIQEIIQDLERKHPNEPEYIQAVTEVLHSVEEIYYQHPEFEKAKIIERMVEPDRIITFRVTWVDDKGEVQTNLGYRVQYNNAIGPYKGGLRFHASVNLSILKFLGFEQTFKIHHLYSLVSFIVAQAISLATLTHTCLKTFYEVYQIILSLNVARDI